MSVMKPNLALQRNPAAAASYGAGEGSHYRTRA